MLAGMAHRKGGIAMKPAERRGLRPNGSCRSKQKSESTAQNKRRKRHHHTLSHLSSSIGRALRACYCAGPKVCGCSSEEEPDDAFWPPPSISS